jgi:putative transcriptional regulator
MLYKLKELRKQYNLSCDDMASILKISKTYYWQLEQGKRRLFYKQALDIANIFNLKPDDIFYDDLK